jgi:hypothetical protein
MAQQGAQAARQEAQAQREITSLRHLANVDTGQAQAAITSGQVKIGLLEKEKQKLNELLMGSVLLSDTEQTNHMTRIAQIEQELTFEEQRVMWGNQVLNAKSNLGMAEQFEAQILARSNQERHKSIIKEKEAFIETIKLAVGMGILTKNEGQAMIATVGASNAIANQGAAAAGATPPVNALGNTAQMSGLKFGTLSKYAGLASMALMFFPENEDAMQASMILMTASMVPMIFSMNSLGHSTRATTGSLISFQAVVSMGATLALIAGALFAAHLLWKNTASEMAATTDEYSTQVEEVQQATYDWGSAMYDAELSTLDFAHTTEESMDKAKESVQDFANAREELFFGFSPSRMNQSLFQSLVNQGVGELYYRSEISIQNNFFGMTPEEAVDEIATLLEARLVTV